MEQAIKFRIKNQDDHFYNDLKQRVALYLQTQPNGRFGNWITIVKALLFLPLFWGAYFLILFGHFAPSAIIGLYASLGITGLFSAFNLSHDAAHGSLTPSRFWNKIIYYCTFDVLGTDAYLWKMRHNASHHIFPNVDGVDADIDSNFLIRLSPNRPLLPHHKWQYLYGPLLYLFFTLHWVFIKDLGYLRRKSLANLRNIHHPPAEVFGFFAAKAFHLFYMIFLPIALGVAWQTVFSGFVAFHFTLSFFFLFTNIMNHHSEEALFPRRDAEGYLPGSWAQHQIVTCLDFHPTSRAWSFFFGGFNSHCAHHLFPQLCHVHYPEISKMIIELTAQYGIPYHQMSWWKSILSHFRHIKTLGTTPPVEPVFVNEPGL